MAMVIVMLMVMIMLMVMTFYRDMAFLITATSAQFLRLLFGATMMPRLMRRGFGGTRAAFVSVVDVIRARNRFATLGMMMGLSEEQHAIEDDEDARAYVC